LTNSFFASTHLSFYFTIAPNNIDVFNALKDWFSVQKKKMFKKIMITKKVMITKIMKTDNIFPVAPYYTACYMLSEMGHEANSHGHIFSSFSRSVLVTVYDPREGRR